jgi:hypothetical protein
MSMLSHSVRILPGNTFRLQLAAVTPYNADFGTLIVFGKSSSESPETNNTDPRFSVPIPQMATR